MPNEATTPKAEGSTASNSTQLLYSFGWKDPRKMTPEELFMDYLSAEPGIQNINAARKALGI